MAKNKLKDIVTGLVLSAGLVTAIRFSPGHYHMKAYEEASQLVKDNWTSVYKELGVQETRWNGFDLTTEQLKQYVKEHKTI